MQLGIVDVYRLHRLGLLPRWMWQKWSENLKNESSMSFVSFDQKNHLRRAFLLFSLCLACFYPGLTEQGVRLFGPISLGFFLLYVSYTVRFIRWARDVERLYSYSDVSLNGFIDLSHKEFQQQVRARLVSLARDVIERQKQHPQETKSFLRKLFNRHHSFFRKFYLVDRSWKPYFDAAEKPLATVSV